MPKLCCICQRNERDLIETDFIDSIPYRMECEQKVLSDSSNMYGTFSWLSICASSDWLKLDKWQTFCIAIVIETQLRVAVTTCSY